MRDEPLHAVHAGRLLVGDRGVHERPARPETARQQPSQRDGHGSGEIQHVHGAASPDDAVLERRRERIVRPPVRVHRHHVGMSHEEQARRLRVAPLEPHDQAFAAGQRGEPAQRDARRVEVVLEKIRAAGLVAGLGRPVVHAFVADEPLEKVGDLGGGIGGHHHAAAVTPARRLSSSGADRGCVAGPPPA